MRFRLLLPLLLLPVLVASCRSTDDPVYVPNDPPSIALLLPVPDPGGDPVPMEADQGLTFRASVADAEDDPEEMLIDWSAVRTDAGDSTDPVTLGQTVPDSSGLCDFVVAGLDAGAWLVVARVTDTDGASDDASMPVLVIAVNAPPEVEIVTPAPGDAAVEGDVVTFTAAVADDRGTGQLAAEWFSSLDGVIDTSPPSAAGLLAFSTSTLTVGAHTVTLTVTDGGGLSSQDAVVFDVASGNLPPTTPSVDLLPDHPDTLDDLVCTVTVAPTDPEGLPVTLSFVWFLDGSPTAWVGSTLTADQTSAGQTWTCTLTGSDGVLLSEPASDSATVAGTEPQVDSVTLGPVPAYEDSVISCSGVGWWDPDGDPEGYEYAWYRGGLPIAASSPTLDGADFDRDDVVSCELTPWDGALLGIPVASAAVLIEDTPPTPPSVALVPSPTAPLGADLACSASGSTDLDPADTPAYEVAWLLDGLPEPAWDGVWTLPASATSLGDHWDCVVWATDGTAASAAVAAGTDVLPQPGDLVISEYMPRPDAVPDVSGEWVEVYNASGAALDLFGFELHDDGTDSYVVTGSLVVPAGARVVLARNSDFVTNGGVLAAWEYSNFALDDTIDEIAISFGPVEVDRVEYDWTGELLGHSASFDPALGAPDDVANDVQANWCGSSVPIVAPGGDFGTPGGANDSCDCWDSDGDLDGWGDASACALPDCNDYDAAISPEAWDDCENGVDEDCTGADALCDCLATDGDGDGYGTGAACSPADCDDGDVAIHPGATEVCDSVDNDCDSSVDEGFDGDFDSFTTCEGDCDDSAVSVHPTATETCNGTDDDCDSSVDEGFDADGDSYTSCGGDCADGNPAIHPGASDVCNGVNDDCDGSLDEDAAGDAWEPNDSAAAAVLIATDDSTVTIWPTIDYSTDADDWFEVSATDDFQIGCDSFSVSAGLSSIPSGADYDLYLYDEAGTLLDWSTNWDQADESVSWAPGCLSPGEDGGLFLVRVNRWSGWSCSDTYRLQVSNSG